VTSAGERTLVYEAARTDVRQLAVVDRRGTLQARIGDPAPYRGFAFAPSGSHVLAERVDAAGIDLWLIDVARGATTRAIAPSGREPMAPAGDRRFPVFSADGRRMLYQTQRGGRAVVLEQPLLGGAERVVFEYPGEGVLYVTDASSDGFVVIGVSGAARRYIAAVPRAGGDPMVLAEGAGLRLHTGRLSRDGRWLAYVSGESGGRDDVYVSPVPPTGERWQVSTGGGAQPSWRGDGRELFYLAPDGRIMAVAIRTAGAFEAGTPAALFAASGPGSPFSASAFHVSADGERFLLNSLREGDTGASTTTLQVITNWTRLAGR
jgi:Tol biopolymer transport system component